MTTKPSSSRPATPASPIVLIDASGRTVGLGAEIGRGGEGSIYEVQDDPALVAKLYHKWPLPAEQAAKLAAMSQVWSPEIEAISAWPRAILLDPATKQARGLVMARMVDARPLHELYGTTNRRRHFPEAAWHHLILAARNVAAAFQTLHNAGVVLGDVNQGNVLVDRQMCARLIDCDSFQINHDGKTFPCPVGTPHFTPPELQSLKLREVTRSENHDRFGMAVLIFHILFVGRHPFAGRYRGAGDMPIEKAISERRFAFSRDKNSTLVDPPPASLLLDDLPPSLAALFESALRCDAEAGQTRPKPEQWVAELESLLKLRKACSFDPMHIFYRQVAECPWCRIEDAGGPSFFVPASGSTIISNDRLAAFDKKIKQLREIEFPDFPAARLELPPAPPIKSLKEKHKWSSLDAAAAVTALGWLLCVVGVKVHGGLIGAGVGLALAGIAWLAFSGPGRRRQKQVAEFTASLAKSRDRLAKMAQGVLAAHRKRLAAFEASTADLQTTIQNYGAKGEKLIEVVAQSSLSDRSAFLRGFTLRDHFRSIPTMTASKVSMLESFGVETAYDVERLTLYGIPNIDGETTIELLNWRANTEKGFTHKPDHGVTLTDLKVAGDLATKRVKLSMARKIINGSKQLENLAALDAYEDERALRQFDDAAEKWVVQAKAFRDFQSRRTALERHVNNRPLFSAAGTLVLGGLTALLYLMFR